MITQRDLQRGFNTFRARVREEDATKALGCNAGQTLCKLKSNGVAHIEGWRIIERRHLARDGVDNFLATMTSIDCPQPSGPIKDFFVVIGTVKHAACRYQHAGCALKPPVWRERHPKGVKAGSILARFGGFGNCHNKMLSLPTRPIKPLREGDC